MRIHTACEACGSHDIAQGDVFRHELSDGRDPLLCRPCARRVDRPIMWYYTFWGALLILGPLVACLLGGCAMVKDSLQPTDTFSGKGPDCYDTKRNVTLYVGISGVPLGSYDCTRDRNGAPKAKY